MPGTAAAVAAPSNLSARCSTTEGIERMAFAGLWRGRRAEQTSAGDLLTLHSHHALNISLNPQGGLAGRRGLRAVQKKGGGEAGVVGDLSRGSIKLTASAMELYQMCKPVLTLIYTTTLWTTSPTTRFRRARG